MRDALVLFQSIEKSVGKFDFFQLLRLIENAHPEQARIGKSLRPRDDAVRFAQNPELAFLPTAVSAFEPASDHKQARLFVNFFGLTGPNGPLPTHLTEYARDRLRNANDPTFARFLDIFHHRMLSLFYRARAAGEPVINLDREEDDRFSTYVGSLFGIGSPSLRMRDQVPDFAKLHFAGLMTKRVRNAAGLANILREFFQLPFSIEQFVGHWMALPMEARTRLGALDGSSVLGSSIVLGGKVWDSQSKFRIVVGPLDYVEYCRMLPSGDSLKILVDWVRNYVGDALEWDVRLILKKEQIPVLKLGNSRLGLTSWLHKLPPTKDSNQLLLNPIARAINLQT